MRNALFILCTFCLSCGDADFENHVSSKLMGKKRCGANTPCQCGYVLAENRILNGQDNLKNCNSNTTVAALTLINGAKLDCAGETISVRLNSKGNYDNIATAIWIKSDSDGSEVKNCKIIGFGEAIYAEFEYIYGASSVEERVPKNLSFTGNTIMLGQGGCYYGASCEANGILIPGTPKTHSENISVIGNYFSMMRSPKTDKDSFLHYGSYFRATGAKNVVIAFNYFDKINYGYALRLLYGVENTWIVGNTFRMPWERYQITPKWTPSGIGIEMYNHAKEGYPTFSMLAFNTFLMSEDANWPPEPFGAPPATGVNHEYVGIRSGFGPTIPPVLARFNWWKKLDGTNYSDTDVARLVYGKNYTVYGIQYEPNYRGILYLPRLY